MAWAGRLSPRRLLAIGLLLREALGFWTGHPWDMEVWIRNAYYVAHGADPYNFLGPVPGVSFAYLDLRMTSVGYLPLWSLLVAGLYDLYAVIPGANRFLLYFLIKQPPILGDVALGYVLLRLVRAWGGTEGLARGTMALWTFFPYTILISAVWGQFDSLVALLWCSSLLVVGQARRSGLLGAGVLLKFFPIITLPFYLLDATLGPRLRRAPRSVDDGRPWLPGWGGVMAGAIPVAFTLGAYVAFHWRTPGILAMLGYETHGTPGGMTSARLVVLPPTLQFVPTTVLLLEGLAWPVAVVGATVLALRWFPTRTPSGLVQALLLILVAFLLFRWSVYEQYLIYLLVFQLLDVTLWHPERSRLFRMTWVLGLAFLVLNNFLLLRFLGPILPSALTLDLYFDTVPPIAYVRYGLLDVVGVLFSLHLLQLFLVLLWPGRGTTPWVLKPLRRLWTPSMGARPEGGSQGRA